MEKKERKNTQTDKQIDKQKDSIKCMNIQQT